MLNSVTCQTIEETVGYTFRNKGLLTQAFTRASFHNEHPAYPDNEVLELIGDSVLSLTVLTYFREVCTQTTARGLITDWNEGKLSALKSALVNKKTLADRMKRLDLQQYLLLSKGDLGSGIDREDSVLEDLFESIIGAIYIDSGEDFAKTSAAVRRMLDLARIVEESRKKVHISYRNDLQEWCQDPRRALGVPQYTDTPLTDGSFRSDVSLPALGLSAHGSAKNTKQAREAAAKELLTRLESLPSHQFERPAQQSVNYIGKLLELAQALHIAPPVYTELGEELLPDHSYRFTVSCSCAGYSAVGVGSSKKAARHCAAQQVIDRIKK